jgi:AraC-like DNA-binding protein
MEPSCTFDHKKCINSDLKEWPLIEVVDLTHDLVRPVTCLTIVYVMRGVLEVTSGTSPAYALNAGDLMLFAPDTYLTCYVEPTTSVTAIMLKIRNRVAVCDKFSFGNLFQNDNHSPVSHAHLAATPTIRAFMDQLVVDITGPLRCFRFMELKIIEFFYYVKAFYCSSQLSRFVQPLLSPNAQFMHFIWNNYRKVRNATEFARMANCSASTFKIRFREATGLSPAQWLNEQKARNVFHDIRCGEKSLKEISEDYHFSSVSHLGVFCRKKFGISPGTIKSMVKKDQKYHNLTNLHRNITS